MNCPTCSQPTLLIWGKYRVCPLCPVVCRLDGSAVPIVADDESYDAIQHARYVKACDLLWECSDADFRAVIHKLETAWGESLQRQTWQAIVRRELDMRLLRQRSLEAVPVAPPAPVEPVPAVSGATRVGALAGDKVVGVLPLPLPADAPEVRKKKISDMRAWIQDQCAVPGRRILLPVEAAQVLWPSPDWESTMAGWLHMRGLEYVVVHREEFGGASVPESLRVVIRTSIQERE